MDSNLDLSFERIVDISPELVWQAWTNPDHIKKWFTPAPWQTVDCEIDLRPGGIFRTVMRSPEGKEFPGTGCYLEIVKNRKLVWTNGLAPGYRPVKPPAVADGGDFQFTAVVELEPQNGGTKYRATVIHGDPEAKKKHEAMGFEHGWGTALDQMVALMKSLN